MLSLYLFFLLTFSTDTCFLFLLLRFVSLPDLKMSAGYLCCYLRGYKHLLDIYFGALGKLFTASVVLTPIVSLLIDLSESLKRRG